MILSAASISHFIIDVKVQNLKILILSHKFFPDIGGIESISEMLANAFVAEGNEVKVLTWTISNGEKKFPFEIFRSPSLPVLIRQIKWSDIVFENNPCIRLSWPNFFLRKPMVTGLQTWIAKTNGEIGIWEKIKKRWILLSDELIACSEAVRTKTAERAHVIGNPYNDHLFYRDELIDKLKEFVFLGRLVSDKGAQLAIESLDNLLQSSSKRLQLTVIGSGPEKEQLEKLVQRKGLNSSVSFTGGMSGKELVDELNRHHFLVVPSLWQEPFGIVALEGLACGCIPIVSDGGGLPDAVGKAGLVFRRGSVESLKEKMIEAIEDTNKMLELKKAAPVQLESHKYVSVARRYLKVFEMAIKNK